MAISCVVPFTPTTPTPSFPEAPIVPATWVPWPWSSIGLQVRVMALNPWVPAAHCTTEPPPKSILNGAGADHWRRWRRRRFPNRWRPGAACPRFSRPHNCGKLASLAGARRRGRCNWARRRARRRGAKGGRRGPRRRAIGTAGAGRLCHRWNRATRRPPGRGAPRDSPAAARCGTAQGLSGHRLTAVDHLDGAGATGALRRGRGDKENHAHHGGEHDRAE